LSLLFPTFSTLINVIPTKEFENDTITAGLMAAIATVGSLFVVLSKLSHRDELIASPDREAALQSLRRGARNHIMIAVVALVIYLIAHATKSPVDEGPAILFGLVAYPTVFMFLSTGFLQLGLFEYIREIFAVMPQEKRPGA
jgi:hypothetical protein